ncbi:MAG: hypothetical protein A2033_13845 [Bacteroidetes bacterium GWA2_31_9]|nr:MAG: hypothetical protein A2033_13845 [Bacteroidetes bacterium GWA2_31_9]
MEQISIPLNDEIASLYISASREKRKKAELLINLWLKDFFKSKKNPKDDLFKTMDEISDIAMKNGLTPEILEEILNEES